jgi:hypothetical protein
MSQGNTHKLIYGVCVTHTKIILDILWGCATILGGDLCDWGVYWHCRFDCVSHTATIGRQT